MLVYRSEISKINKNHINFFVFNKSYLNNKKINRINKKKYFYTIKNPLKYKSVNKKNLIIILMSIELILLSVNINFIAFSAYINDISGQIFAMLTLTVAAAEAAIGLAILVVFFRNLGSIEVNKINQLKG